MIEEQFLRISRLIGDDNIKLLHEKHITIVGIGAVGSNALESLVRSGIGKVRIIDFDTISYSNINRQLIALHSNIGKLKINVAKERILDINPFIEVEAINTFAAKENAKNLFKNTDLILDCIDSLTPKIEILEYAYKNNIPIISSMGAALRRDISLIKVSDIKDTWACPLARQVRSGLKKRGIQEGIKVIFSPEEVNYKYTKIEDEVNLERTHERGRDRVILGSLAMITSAFGQYMASEALKHFITDQSFEGKIAWNPQAKERGEKN